VSFIGTLTSINQALNGMSLMPAVGSQRVASLLIGTTDAGTGGIGGSKSDTDGVQILVGGVVVTTTSDLANGNTSSVAALNANNGGDGISLREAILATNATPNGSTPDIIIFGIGSGLQTITPTSALPPITDAVFIDGTTQSGFVGTPLIELNGASAGGIGMSITAGSATIRGLVINRFVTGLSISGGDGGNVLEGNYIGTDPTGTIDRGNLSTGVSINYSSDNPNKRNDYIGGTGPGTSNVIAGNDQIGISIFGSNTKLIWVQGNQIGTTASGSAALVGNGAVGIYFDGGAMGLVIGGLDANSRNVIAGHGVGISLRSIGSEVKGNFIGTNGTLALGGAVGIEVTGSANGIVIGGVDPGSGNVISGNSEGIRITSGQAADIRIWGNYIGTSPDGMSSIGNTSVGVNLLGSVNARIGGTDAVMRNVISGNLQDGIRLSNGATGNLVQGNYIGTNLTGTAPLPNGSDGVEVDTTVAISNTIGGTVTGAGNLLSGNTGAGIRINGKFTLVQGNLIGTNATATGSIGNGGDGVIITALNNTVGGEHLGAGNRIAYNGGTGVAVTGATSTGNRIQGNSIYSNSNTATLGIDLGADGITGNDYGDPLANPPIPPDTDGSPNHFQNYPDLAGAFVGGLIVQDGIIAPISTVVRGTLASTPSAAAAPQKFVLEFFASPASGSPRRFLGRSAVTTDGSGNASFEFVFPSAVSLGELVTATATNASTGDTSEFAAAVPVTNNSVATIALTVTTSGSGTGTVTSLPLGITFPSDITESYPIGTLVTLTATADSGSTFVSWTGQGIDTPGVIVGNTSTLTVLTTTQARTVTANFTQAGISTPPIVTYTEATPLWFDGMTFTWLPATIPADRHLEGYLVRVGVEPGVYGDPIFVPPTQTSLTLTDLPPVEHFFTVSTVTQLGPAPSSEELVPLNPSDSPLLEPVAAPVISNQSFTITENSPIDTVVGTIVASDPDPGQTVTLTVTGGTGQAAFTVLPISRVITVKDSRLLNYEAGPSLTLHVTATDNGASPSSTTATITINLTNVAGNEPLVLNMDRYATVPGLQIGTVRATGVLANDFDPEGNTIKAYLVTPPDPDQGSLLPGLIPDGLNRDGSFIFVPTTSFTGTTYTYKVSEDNGTTFSLPVTVTLISAQESGQSQESGTTSDAGLQGWTPVLETTTNGPANWSGTQNPVLAQFSGIGVDGDTTWARPGTHLYKSTGLADGRTDYRLLMTLRSDVSPGGAVGVMFRYQDPSNYYRFSMDNSPVAGALQNQAYYRLIKMVGGTTTLLTEQVVPVGQEAYTSGTTYELEIVAVGQSLILTLANPTTGQAVWHWDGTDATFTSNGIALYSASNPGGYYDLIGVQGENPDPTLRGLEVRPTGLGLGTVTSNPGGVVFPGSPAATFPVNSTVTLTATEASGSAFGGWSGTGLTPHPTDPKQVFVDMSEARIITAQFDTAPLPSLNLDIDNNGQVSALTDGVLLVRYLFGVRGTALTQGALGPPPATGPDHRRTDPDHIVEYLDQARSTMLDVDGNGVASALQDGVMLVRYLFGVRDAALTQGALAPNAHELRDEATEVQDWIGQYMTPAAMGSSAASASEMLSSSAQVSALSPQSSARLEQVGHSSIGDEPSLVSRPSTELGTVSQSNVSLAPDSTSPAIAAVQLSSTSLQSPAWVPEFLAGEEEEDEILVKL
jgi:hypothetical protein